MKTNRYYLGYALKVCVVYFILGLALKDFYPFIKSLFDSKADHALIFNECLHSVNFLSVILKSILAACVVTYLARRRDLKKQSAN
ncbi:hypothetical protein [Arundinibacter roseus]|uniref:Uncharacterized protein n=1 Tax=Arundinibacter roseus TaxID=2070510 RepID=A0A4R4KQ14_9BACT|nr:hypothetical protein [Arundinibacter roseus]TDB69026.1 hypothetical protein EZE20_01450 [Arundinibacter roseus]